MHTGLVALFLCVPVPIEWRPWTHCGMRCDLQSLLSTKLMMMQNGAFGIENDLDGGANMVVGGEAGGVRDRPYLAYAQRGPVQMAIIL
jgi:hypothetical protein